VCTRGLFFVPNDLVWPIVRFPFRSMREIPTIMAFDDACGGDSDEKLVMFRTHMIVEMRERGVDHPYNVKELADDESDEHGSKWMFSLTYSSPNAFIQSLKTIFDVANRPRRSMNKAEEESLLQSVLAPRRVVAFDPSWLVDYREKLLFSPGRAVARIEPLVNYPGCIELTDQRIYFQPARLNNVAHPILHWEYTAIEQLYKRRYLLRQTGLEIYLKTGESFFFSFRTRKDRDDMYELLVEQPTLARFERSNLEEMLHKWQRREISNFDYLMFLNNAAGRTKNDLTQYPVFPWILQDYTSETLDFTNPSVFRDLSKPVGALNEERLAYFRTRFEMMPRGEEAEGMPPPFLYGTHYSTPGYVLYYLVRMVPQHMLCLQGGKFDAADRLFRSIDVTWQGCTTNHTDVKELIPEFFDTALSPEHWLTNHQQLDLGTTQNLQRVNDIQLPPWACGSPLDFVRKNREALESEYVSQHLHEWIDLIFGFKQQGEEAEKANNCTFLFSPHGWGESGMLTLTSHCSILLFILRGSYRSRNGDRSGRKVLDRIPDSRVWTNPQAVVLDSAPV
jgi:factor associated with neutral sphingomyelinase activation